MKTQTDNYSYTSEDKQYETYNLSTSDWVTAEYIPAVNPLHSRIPFIEALPHPKDALQCMQSYAYTVPFDCRKIAECSILEKMQQISMLQQLRFALPFTPELEYEMYRALCDSYAARHQFYDPNAPLSIYAFNKEELTYGKVIANQSSASVRGFSLIGNSGSGKSSAIDMLVSHYPQVIKHPRSSAKITQIVYLVVNCPPNSNFNQLYISIAAEFDKALGLTNSHYEDQVARTSGLNKKYAIIKRLVETFAVGIIIFDEIQQLDFQGIKENTFESLLTLSNETKVAIAAVGTEDALQKMFPNERTARRVGSFIHASSYCNDIGFFKYLAQNLSRYYWFDTPLTVTDDIINTLFKYSNGIIAHLITIYTYMNIDYVKATKKPNIDVNFIKAVVNRHFSGLSKLLTQHKNKEQTEKKANEIMRQATANFETLIAANKQQQFIEAAKTSIGDLDTNLLLSHIVTNIQQCFSEYSTETITTAFNKIYAKQKNQGISERELTALVVKTLQKTTKPKVSKGQKPTPEEIRMNLATAYQP